MFLHTRWLQKLSIKVQVLDANLVAMCMPYGDAYRTRNAGASVPCAVLVRLVHMGSHPWSVARHVLAVIGTYQRTVFITNLTLRYLQGENKILVYLSSDLTSVQRW
jgi:hypothetical protein